MDIFLIIIYLWFSLAVTMLIRLFEWRDNGWEYLVIVLAIIFPMVYIPFLFDKIKNILSEVTNMTQTFNLKKSFSNTIDKMAIRFINMLDMLRGDYNKPEPIDYTPTKRITRSQFHKGGAPRVKRSGDINSDSRKGGAPWVKRD